MPDVSPVRTLSWLVAFVCRLLLRLFCQTNSRPQAQAIRAVLESRLSTGTAAIWSFATGYKNSPDILFIGSKIWRGYSQMLETVS